MSAFTLFISNDNLVRLIGLKRASTGAYINNATVTVTLKTLAGVDVSGVAWPLTMAYVAASDGDYFVEIPAAAVITKNITYEAHVDLNEAGDVAHWEIRAKARVREVRG